MQIFVQIYINYLSLKCPGLDFLFNVSNKNAPTLQQSKNCIIRSVHFPLFHSNNLKQFNGIEIKFYVFRELLTRKQNNCILKTFCNFNDQKFFQLQSHLRLGT